jgi:ABC-2 type transport system ATP-binding protein
MLKELFLLTPEDTTNLSVIEVQDLKKSYGSLAAVDGVSFEVKSGEIFSLLGPNGAGKTTAIEIMEGLRSKDSGNVSVLGLDPWKHGYELHKKIGVIPQGFRFFDKATPKEAIKYYADLFGIKGMDVERILREVILEDAKNTLFENLSGGQKQKVGLALSLVNDPMLLFLDEPTTGLDPQARRAVWQVISNLKKAGRSIVLTTHYLEEAEQLADRVAIIDHGRIIAEGSPIEITQRYGSGERIRLTGKGELADYIRRSNFAVKYDEKTSRIEILIRNKGDALDAIRLIEQSNLMWDDLSIDRESLEDVFIKLVGAIDEEGGAGAKQQATEEIRV